METHAIPPPYVLPNGAHPSSPPMTPGTRSHAHFLSGAGHPTPAYKRMDAMLAQSPPLDLDEPNAKAKHFSLPRGRSASLSSTASEEADASDPSVASDSDSEDTDSANTDADDTESDEEFVKPAPRPPRKVEHPHFELEDLGSDTGYDSDLEVVQPDHCEEAKSDRGSTRLDDDGLLRKLNDLRCSGGSSDEDDEQQRIYRRKKKRWSAGIFKRTHSQSVEGDSSYSDNDPLDDVDISARRLRRRVRGPGDRTSLIFEDKGFSNTNNIAEVEEPQDGGLIPHTQGPPSIPSDDGFALDELPFWFLDDTMTVEEIN